MLSLSIKYTENAYTVPFYNLKREITQQNKKDNKNIILLAAIWVFF